MALIEWCDERLMHDLNSFQHEKWMQTNAVIRGSLFERWHHLLEIASHLFGSTLNFRSNDWLVSTNKKHVSLTNVMQKC